MAWMIWGTPMTMLKAPHAETQEENHKLCSFYVFFCGELKLSWIHTKKTNRLTDLFLPACMSHMYRNCQSHDIKCLKISLVFVVTSPFLELHPLPDSHSCLQLRPRRIQLSSWGPDLTRRWPPPTYDLAELKICWAWPNDQVVNESLELERSPR